MSRLVSPRGSTEALKSMGHAAPSDRDRVFERLQSTHQER